MAEAYLTSRTSRLKLSLFQQRHDTHALACSRCKAGRSKLTTFRRYVRPGSHGAPSSSPREVAQRSMVGGRQKQCCAAEPVGSRWANGSRAKRAAVLATAMALHPARPLRGAHHACVASTKRSRNVGPTPQCTNATRTPRTRSSLPPPLPPPLLFHSDDGSTSAISPSNPARRNLATNACAAAPCCADAASAAVAEVW